MTLKNYGLGGCTIDDCENPAFSGQLCSKHYTRKLRYGDPLTEPKIIRFTGVDFDDLVDHSEGPKACWPFLGEIDKQGYGRWRPSGRSDRAHREAFRRAGNDLPPKSSGLVLDHTCHDPRVCEGGPTCPHRRCCNPAHLSLVPNLVNFHDKDRSNGTRGSKPKVLCKEGHPLSGDNLYIAPKTGGRACRECKRIWNREHRRAST